MAKRELINISKDRLIEMVIKIAESYGASISEASDLDCQLSDLPVITEEEIVKPYLEKLKSKIRDRNTLSFMNWQNDTISDNTYKQNRRMYEEMLSIVNIFIDNL